MRRSLMRVISFAAVAAVASAANAELLGQWNFNTPLSPAVTHPFYTWNSEAGSADCDFTINTGDANTTFTTPAGNGSAYCLSADRWSTGDAAWITLNNLAPGYRSFELSWDQTRTATGPSEFRVEVSLNNESFFVIPDSAYSVVQAGALFSGTDPWTANGPRQSSFTRTVQFEGLLVNSLPVTIRFVATGANLGNGAARFDNIVLTSVPAPGAIALLGLAGLAGRRRR